MIARYRDGALAAVPDDASEIAGVLAPLGDDVAATTRRATTCPARSSGSGTSCAHLNRYVEATAPWQLAKDESAARPSSMRVLYDLADGLRVVAIALAAYTPDTTASILAALGQPTEIGWEQVAVRSAPADVGDRAASPLFPRIDAPAAVA